jgi:hypothetical protein
LNCEPKKLSRKTEKNKDEKEGGGGTKGESLNCEPKKLSLNSIKSKVSTIYRRKRESHAWFT